MDNFNAFFDSQLTEENLPGAEFSEGPSNEDITPGTNSFTEILTNVNTAILSMEEANACLESNEASILDLKRTTLKPIAMQCPTDKDKVVESKCFVNSSSLEDVYENSILNFEGFMSTPEKVCTLQDSCSTKDLAAKQQCSFNSSESLSLNSPLESAIENVNKFEVFAEIHSMPELSNATDVALLKGQEMESGSCHTNPNLADESHAEDSVTNDSFHNLATQCGLEREPHNDFESFELINSGNISFDVCDKTKLNSEIESASLIKPCQVVLKRCDSLVEEYFTNYHVSNPSFLLTDQISEVSNTERVLKSVSKKVKSKRCKKKKVKKTLTRNDSNNVVEPCSETPTYGSIETSDTTEVCPGNDSLHSNISKTEINPLGEDVVETRKPIRRKRNASSVISENNSVSIKTGKKLKCDYSTNSENSETPQNESNMRFHKSHHLFESADSEVYSDYSCSKDHFQTSEYKNTKDVEGISSDHCEQTLEDIEKSVINLENNYTDESIDLSELSDNSLSRRLSNQQAEQFDISSKVKPCRVVLTRMEYSSDFSPFSATSIRGSCSFDLSESSDLESEADLFKPKPERNVLNWQTCYEDLYIPKYSCNKEVKTVEKTSNSVSFASVECDDSESNFIEPMNGGSATNGISGFSASRSTAPENVPPDVSAADEIPTTSDQSPELPKKLQKSKKCKKSQRVKESAPGSSRSKKSGVHRELLELYKNEFTQELKDLKTIMKRTERKLDALIKIHEQVIDFYE